MTPSGSSVGIAHAPQQAASRGPFQPHGNPHLFYGGGGRGEILEALVGSVRRGVPVMHVHGERGSGRTLLSIALADRLTRRHRVLRHEGPLTSATLLRTLLLELDPRHADLVAMDSEGRALDVETLDAARRALVAALEERSIDARPLVLLVDGEAECDPGALELAESVAATRAGRATVRFEGSSGLVPDTGADASVPPERRRRRPAVQICLFHRTDPTVSRTLPGGYGVDRPDNHFWLRRLTLTEVGEYLRHHMLLFDYNRRDLFTREMTYFVADRSEGVFRAIDTIARNAFTIAGLQDAERPTLSHLLLAGLPPRGESETSGTSFLSRHRGAVVAGLGLGVVASGLALIAFATR